MDSSPRPTNKLIDSFGRLIELLVFWGLAASSVSALFFADRFRIGMLLTYSPRIVWLAIAAPMLVIYVCRQQKFRIALVIMFSILLIRDLPIGGGALASEQCMTLLSFNSGNEIENTHRIAELCEAKNVDILMIQEVSPANRPKFIETLPGYTFYWAGKSVEFAPSESWVFSSLTGVRNDLIANGKSTEVFSGITGYRTFAVRAEILGRPIQLVNVHSTKPMRLYHGVADLFSYAATKAARHRTEKDRLTQWISDNEQVPTLVAGDFNAPANTYNLRFPELNHAFVSSGAGLHLTYPRSCPIIGIDYALANEYVSFTSCEIVDLGFSDHRAQITRFQIK
jgi:endonuclease/exonuclease/phosphatase (EEP) superfamily protein YafD